MSVEQNDVIDVIGVHQETGFLILTIADHLDWEDTDLHLELLQEKINLYFAAVETGGLLKLYPDAAGRTIVIDIVTQYPVSEVGAEFIKTAAEVAKQLEITIVVNTYTDGLELGE